MIKKTLLFICLIFYSQTVLSFDTTANQAYLVDVQSGEVLYVKNKDQKISPASITKIMTTIVAFDLIKKGELKLDEKFKISKKAWRMSSKGYSSMFIMPNDRVSVEKILNCLPSVTNHVIQKKLAKCKLV